MLFAQSDGEIESPRTSTATRPALGDTDEYVLDIGSETLWSDPDQSDSSGHAPIIVGEMTALEEDVADSRYIGSVDPKRTVRISKLLSYGLRHAPEKVGLELDAAGWADVPGLLRALAGLGEVVTLDDLELLVRTSDKQRFSLSPDRARIRANQGHSIAVDLGLVPREPPDRLYHGTVRRFLEGIRSSGLQRGSRSHVHLSVDEETAEKVAARRKGQAVLLKVRAAAMHADGHVFYRSDNGVWLTEHVPPRYIDYPAA
jgi:putative RNA 2'-phosphotransferase